MKSQPEINIASLEAAARHKRRRRLLFATALLLAALILVLRYREFWFSMFWTTGTNQAEPSASETEEKSLRPTAPSPRHSRSKQHAETAAPSASERSVLPPLQVEIVSAAGRQILHTRIAGVNVEIPAQTSEPAVSETAASGPEPETASAASQVRFSRETTRVVEHPVEPSYPALARQANVQGSVLLLAHIGRDGNIQDVQVLSGPEILSDAAREAVKQWHFKPYYRSGQPIETEARITVNFSISTQ